MMFLYQSEQFYWELTALGAWKALALIGERVCTLFTERWREDLLLQSLNPSSFKYTEYIT